MIIWRRKLYKMTVHTSKATILAIAKSYLNVGLGIPYNWAQCRISGLTKKKLTIAIIDGLLVALSAPIAFFLRFDFSDAAPFYYSALGNVMLYTMLLSLLYAPLFRLYRDLWQFTSLNTMTRVIAYATAIIGTFVALRWLVDRGENIPRSVPILQWLTLVPLLALPRAFVRIVYDHRSAQAIRSRNSQSSKLLPVVVIGMDLMAELFLRHLRRDPATLYQTVGVIDPNSRERGRHIFNIPIFPGNIELPAVIQQLSAEGKRPTHFILTKAFESDRMREILMAAEAEQITICRLPSLIEFRQPGEMNDIAPRPISVEELVGRREARLDPRTIDLFVRGRRILVTGGGGSIGSELVRQLVRYAPAKIVVLDNSEYNLYSVGNMKMRAEPNIDIGCHLCDIRDRRALRHLFEIERPEVVFHAAALKHVPIVEDNPFEGFLTNSLGTKYVADCAREVGSSAFILISTDKAVNPTSIMGACKRLAELYIQALDRSFEEHCDDLTRITRFLTVRFGNVLGSSGSVVPLFQRQLSRGGPLTVTHPDIERYFMTIREAVELILHATAGGSLEQGGKGRIFVLDMGAPVRIVDVARQMIRLAGLAPDVDVKIQFVGLRAGEKMFEELFADEEELRPSEVPGVLTASSQTLSLIDVERHLGLVEAAVMQGDVEEFYLCLRRAVPGYRVAGEKKFGAAAA